LKINSVELLKFFENLAGGFLIASESSIQPAPNKACTGRVGTVRLLEHFSTVEFFLPIERVSASHPPVTQTVETVEKVGESN
jgi:hypothetical protein